MLGCQALPLPLQCAPVPCARVQIEGAQLREVPPPQRVLSGLVELRPSAGMGSWALPDFPGGLLTQTGLGCPLQPGCFKGRTDLFSWPASYKDRSPTPPCDWGLLRAGPGTSQPQAIAPHPPSVLTGSQVRSLSRPERPPGKVGVTCGARTLGCLEPYPPARRDPPLAPLKPTAPPPNNLEQRESYAGREEA